MLNDKRYLLGEFLRVLMKIKNGFFRRFLECQIIGEKTEELILKMLKCFNLMLRNKMFRVF